MSQKETILSLLKSGRQFTVAQLAGLARAAEKSVYNRIGDLRSEGYAIYQNVTKNGKTAYRLGTPKRSMVAVASRVTGSRLFR